MKFLSAAKRIATLASKIHGNLIKSNKLHAKNSISRLQSRWFLTDLSNIARNKMDKKPSQKFTFNVAKHLLNQGLTNSPPKNLLCSPFSMNAVLNMLVPGSKGQVLDQLLNLLEISNEDHIERSALRLMDVSRPFICGDGLEFSFSNALWVDQQSPLTQLYEGMLRDVFKADVMDVDFQCSANRVIEEINHWGKDRTRGMIKSILGDVAYYNDTVMVLSNALHLKLQSPDHKAFDLPNTANTMYYCESLNGNMVLRMPYGRETKKGQDKGSFSMYIFASTDETALPELIEGMMNFSKYTKQNETISEIYIPRINLESVIPLSNTMTALGLTLPFKGGQSELTGFIDSPISDLLYVTDVTQKSHIETNEAGTKLAVVTYATVCGPTIDPQKLSPKQKPAVQNNPFLLLIGEDLSGSIVSAGTMLSTSLTGLSSLSSARYTSYL